MHSITTDSDSFLIKADIADISAFVILASQLSAYRYFSQIRLTEAHQVMFLWFKSLVCVKYERMARYFYVFHTMYKSSLNSIYIVHILNAVITCNS